MAESVEGVSRWRGPAYVVAALLVVNFTMAVIFVCMSHRPTLPWVMLALNTLVFGGGLAGFLLFRAANPPKRKKPTSPLGKAG